MSRVLVYLAAISVVLLVVQACAIPAPGGRATEATPTVDITPDPTAAVRRTPRATPGATERPATPPPTERPTPEPTSVVREMPTGPTQVATVVSVTDGDTIRVLIDGQEFAVRYIGVDTPEVHSGVEWMGEEAAAVNAELVAGREVILEKDVSETDRYGRLLRYVWVEETDGWLLVNLELLRRGVAQVSTYPPDVKYVDLLYLPAQEEARTAGIGLWGAPPTPAATSAPMAPVAPSSDCEPSYPDTCIPTGSADLDCGDVQWRRFRVDWNVPNPDPHRFDGDGDGIGCES